MQCSKCGTNLNASDEKCPQCGLKIDSKVEEAGLPQARPKRPMPRWFKFAIFITFMALVIVSGGLLFTETLVDVAEKQLTSLREHKIEAAYNDFTSARFKEETSLEEFTQFVNSHPILTTNHSVIFPGRSIVDHMTILRGKLLTGDIPGTPIEYRLIKEDGKWKILSMSLLKGQSHNKPEKRKIIRIAKSVLKNISDGNIESGYETYFSDDFKKATSLNDFKSLIQKNPLLANDYQASYHHPVIKGDEGSVSIVLKSDQSVIYLIGHYTQDQDEWKISNLRILSPTIDK